MADQSSALNQILRQTEESRQSRGLSTLQASEVAHQKRVANNIRIAEAEAQRNSLAQDPQVLRNAGIDPNLSGSESENISAKVQANEVSSKTTTGGISSNQYAAAGSLLTATSGGKGAVGIAGSTASGAAVGASVGGIPGAAVGAAVGLTTGLLGAAREEKARKAAIEAQKDERLAKIADQEEMQKQNAYSGMITNLRAAFLGNR